jgi:Protein of unknown function (DUF2804).
MDLEEKKVLLKNRFNPFVSGRKKEWWYTGIVDRANDIFFSFSVIRVMFMDSISVALFDPKNGSSVEASWKGFLDRDNPPDRLSLKADSKNFAFSYSGEAKTGWHAKIESDSIIASLSMEPTIPYFTKFDNLFVDDYTLLHFFMNRAKGEVKTLSGGNPRSYAIDGGLCYYDHCFGTVPAKTKWHWIAVQGETCALASLMNYGAYAQRYTEVFFTDGVAESARNRWIRLDQDVSFECYPSDRFAKHWRITSPDMALKLEVIQTSYERERIPPVVPFIVKLDHWQCSVSVGGWIRVDGTWVEVRDLRGVLEEHHGNW